MNKPKPYHLMTDAERLADRIARNKVIEAKAAVTNNRRAVVQRLRNGRKIGQLLTDLDRQGFFDGMTLEEAERRHLRGLLEEGIQKGWIKPR